MIESLGFYLPNLFAAVVTCVALALMGALLASRTESLQAFVASQSASLGITFGLAVQLLLLGSVEEYPYIPVVGAFLFAFFFYAMGQKLCERHRIKSTEILVSFFLISLALNYLITSALPSLESHFSSSFMGDIATASSLSSYWLGTVALVAIAFLGRYFKKIMLQSFWLSGSGVLFSPRLGSLFYVVCAVLVVESTRVFGFLFTSASLVVLPLAASLASRSLKGFTVRLILLAAVSSVLGFLISLYFQNVSTSASIVVTQLGVGLLMGGLGRERRDNH